MISFKAVKIKILSPTLTAPERWNTKRDNCAQFSETNDRIIATSSTRNHGHPDNPDSVREKAIAKLADGVRKTVCKTEALESSWTDVQPCESAVLHENPGYDSIGTKDPRIIRSWGNKRGCRLGDAGWTRLDRFENWAIVRINLTTRRCFHSDRQRRGRSVVYRRSRARGMLTFRGYFLGELSSTEGRLALVFFKNIDNFLNDSYSAWLCIPSRKNSVANNKSISKYRHSDLHPKYSKFKKKILGPCET